MNADTGLPLRLLLAAFATGTLLHVDRAPLWCTIVAALALAWRVLHARGRLPLPGRTLRFAFAAALLGAVLVSFRTVNGLAAGSALLIVMGAAKLLETRTTRDAVVVATVSLLLVLAAVLDRQSLPRLPACLLAGWLSLGALAALGSHAAARSTWRAMRTAGSALVMALPLAVLCFLLVPRLPAGLWSAPPGGAATTGLSDEMSPGSISELALSDAIAFRVRFPDGAPPPAQRYWRGPVLHDFDGYTWRRRPGQGAIREHIEPLSAPVRYEVMLEPHGRPDLFGLDTIARIDGRRNMRTFDGQVIAFRPVTAAITYEGVSHLEVRYPSPLSINGRRLDSRLPEGRNPRSTALARTLRAQAGSDAAFAEAALAHLREGGFEYTLTPPLLDLDSVDDLLFRTRRGFCGHFASAYATLMRAGGVPARVVTGYMGGTWNAIGGYYTVRQSDAHAWTEIWLEGRGWVRVDPTAVVAPARLQRGLDELLAIERGATEALLGTAGWWRTLRDSWDAAGSWWQSQVVQFNRSSQQDLLARLGIAGLGYRGLGTALLAGAALWVLGVMLLLSRRAAGARPDPLGRQWARFIALLEKRGLHVAPHEGPDALRRRARQAFPEAAADIDACATRYAHLRFGPQAAAADPAWAREFSRLLRRIARATAARRRPRTAPAARE